MKKNLQTKAGSAILTAIGMGVVLFIIIAAVYSFSSYRMQATILEGQRVKALAIAEAGLELAIGELLNNSGFATHVTTKEFEWKNALPRKHSQDNNSDHGFKITSGNSGFYGGKLGDGEFKVKVGCIPYKDDDKTKTIDESFSFLRIEALGRFENTVRRVEAVINRRYPAREFLMYDGGFLSLVYGEPKLQNKNVFSTGHLYGHSGVEIGRIMLNAHSPVVHGTTQELDDMNAIISGAGGIFIYSPIKAKFREKRGVAAKSVEIPKNITFPTNGTYKNPADKKFGAYPEELKGDPPPIDDSLKPWIKTKDDGISITPRAPSFTQLKAEAKTAKGMFFAKTDSGALSKKYKMPNGWTADNSSHLPAVILDFGSNIRESKVTLPANFNGIIYSEKDIVIKGNPPVDVQIISDKNVFVAGDFNQSGDPKSATQLDKFDEYYGLPQDYIAGSNALTATDYTDNIKLKLTDDVNATAYKNHVAAKVIARERIVYDYRSPVDAFENELFPYMKYELAKRIADDDAAKANCLERNRSGTLNASSDQATFEAAIDDYFAKFPIEKISSSVSSTPTEDSLKDELKQLYANKSGKFNFSDFDAISKKIWQGYVKNYESDNASERGALSDKGKSPAFGVYPLLRNLRAKLGVPGNGMQKDFEPTVVTDKPGDFLYFPEMTTNGMFVSCGELNNLFYAGPDYTKIYNKIGLSDTCVSSGIGLKHSETTHFVHRVYGSEMNLRLYPVHRNSGGFYIPPTRRKIYDESLPKLGMETSKFELAGYVIISWKDTAALPEEYDDF